MDSELGFHRLCPYSMCVSLSCCDLLWCVIQISSVIHPWPQRQFPRRPAKPLILVISHPSSPLSFPLCSVTWHSGSLCPVTLLLCVCVRVCAHTLVCPRSGPIGPLLHDNRTISVLLAHLCLSFCPSLPSFNSFQGKEVRSLFPSVTQVDVSVYQ